MCGPVLGILGAAVSAFGSIYSGMAQSSAMEAQAKAKEYEAQAQRETGSYESVRQDERNKRITGQQVTAIAASGVDFTGTPGAVVADTRSEGEMDKQAIRYGAQFKSNLSQYEAQIARMNASSARTGGFLGALTPLINGARSFTGLQTSFG